MSFKSKCADPSPEPQDVCDLSNHSTSLQGCLLWCPHLTHFRPYTLQLSTKTHMEKPGRLIYNWASFHGCLLKCNWCDRCRMYSGCSDLIVRIGSY